MYSCNTERLETVKKGNTSWPGFNSVKVCRFDKRYDEMHQELGCKNCTKQWDSKYLKAQGLIK